MSDRRILHTLGALFVIAGAGQLLSAAPGISEVAARMNDAGPSVPTAARRVIPTEPIRIVDERTPTKAPIRLIPDEEVSDGESVAETMVTAEDPKPAVAPTTPVRLASAAPAKALASVKAVPTAPQSISQVAPVKNPPMQRQKLADIYAQMPANKSAKILSALSPAEAAAFIGLMPQEAGASVLSEMSADAAVAITREVLRETR